MSDLRITPGFVDLHVHLREPGTNDAETIESGTRTALLGGAVLVADMPNNPGAPVWTNEQLVAKQEIAKRSAWIPIAFYAGSQPEFDNIDQLKPMARTAIGLKLYGEPTTGNVNTYEAQDFLEIVGEWHKVAPSKPIMLHAAEENLQDMIDLVGGQFGHHLHVCHVNDPAQVDAIGAAKAEGLPVTCGVCPHHLLKTSHDRMTQGAFAEMKPPLALQYDAEELMRMLDGGQIDVIESDYAPHSLEEKYKAEHSGGHCYGVPGIEHIMPLLMYQVAKNRLSHRRLLQATHYEPAKILGVKLNARTAVKWDTSDGAYRIQESDVVAQCGWSPYIGMLALGKLQAVMIGGSTAVDNGKLIAARGRTVSSRGTII